jgi:bifunctional DNA primase/polymerase-like protein
MRAEEREALRAAMRLDYPSFPCLANKRPACPHGFKDACTATSGLATLWARYPGELVGVPTGTASGISVLDVDRGKGGGDWWLANRDRLPATRLHRTRSGGIHAVFKHRTGLRNSVARIAPGIDVRAEGGYIVWWPLTGLKAHNATLADWPDWLVPPEPPAHEPPKTDTGRRGSTDAKLRGLLRCVEEAKEGERNAVLFWAACRAAEMLRNGELPSQSFGADILRLVAARAGLPDWEARRTIASGFRRAA